MVSNLGLLGATALSGLLGIGSAGMGAMAANASQLRQYEYNKLLQKQQAKLNYQYNYKYLKNANTWTNLHVPILQRQGLELAGYNPMLAVQNGTSGVNAGSMSGAAGSSSVNAPDYAGSIQSGMSNALDVMRLRNEVQQTEANTDVAYSQADKNKAEKASILEKLPFISQREKAEIANIEKDSMHKESLIHQIDETIRLREKELELQKYGIDMGYKGTVYNADSVAETQRGTYSFTNPFGLGSQTGYLSPDSDLRHNFYHTGTHYTDHNTKKFRGYSNDRKYWSNYYY